MRTTCSATLGSATVGSATLVMLAIGTLWAGICFAETYKWVDTDGNVIYSQTKPAGGEPVETLEHYTAPPDEEIQPVDEREASIKENCKVARFNKAVLQTPAKVVNPDTEGEILLTASEKEKPSDGSDQTDNRLLRLAWQLHQAGSVSQARRLPARP